MVCENGCKNGAYVISCVIDWTLDANTDNAYFNTTLCDMLSFTREGCSDGSGYGLSR